MALPEQALTWPPEWLPVFTPVMTRQGRPQFVTEITRLGSGLAGAKWGAINDLHRAT